MKYLIGIILFGLVLQACSTTNYIVLPNGQKGLVIDCTQTKWSACFKSAGELCSKGYEIYERAIGEFTESKIPITELPKKAKTEVNKMVVGNPMQHSIMLEDKYMVISCSV